MHINKYLSHKTTEPIKKRLKSYSVLAGSVLAGICPAIGAVQYTDVDPDKAISQNFATMTLDLNNDSVPDFLFSYIFTAIFGPVDDIQRRLEVKGLNPNNEIAGLPYPNPFGFPPRYASVFGSGDTIDGNLSFTPEATMAGRGSSPPLYALIGEWLGATYQILGLKFELNGQTHYGWARLSLVDVSVNPYNPKVWVVLHDYAWETTPNTPIVTDSLEPCPVPTNIGISDLDYNTVRYYWDSIPFASGYELRGREVTGPLGYQIIKLNDPKKSDAIANTLEPGTEYELSMRAICYFDTDTSDWSTPIVFETFSCDPPDSIYVSNLTTDSVTLNWTPAPGIGTPGWYRIVGREVGSPNLTSFRVEYPITTLQVNNLTPGTTYQWAVFTECESTVQSLLTPLNTFTTPGSIAKRTDDHDLQLENNHKLTIMPNPLHQRARIQFDNPDKTPYQLVLTDLSGKIVRTVNNITSNEIYLEKGNLSIGMYLLELRGKKHYIAKVIIGED